MSCMSHFCIATIHFNKRLEHPRFLVQYIYPQEYSVQCTEGDIPELGSVLRGLGWDGLGLAHWSYLDLPTMLS